jgi:hypothetical protein
MEAEGYGPQTARWRGGGPGRGRGVAPRTDSRTQPRETARQGGEGLGGRTSHKYLGSRHLEKGVMSGELPFTHSLLSIPFLSSFYSLCSYF